MAVATMIGSSVSIENSTMQTSLQLYYVLQYNYYTGVLICTTTEQFMSYIMATLVT